MQMIVVQLGLLASKNAARFGGTHCVTSMEQTEKDWTWGRNTKAFSGDSSSGGNPDEGSSQSRRGLQSVRDLRTASGCLSS